jgi:hypothetical protein
MPPLVATQRGNGGEGRQVAVIGGIESARAVVLHAGAQEGSSQNPRDNRVFSKGPIICSEWNVSGQQVGFFDVRLPAPNSRSKLSVSTQVPSASQPLTNAAPAGVLIAMGLPAAV